MQREQFYLEVMVFEGFATHLYLDSKGYMTIGIGIMFPSLNALLSSGLIFTNRITGKTATKEEISDDWNAVTKQGKGKLASSYKKFTKLDGNPTELQARFEALMQNAKNDAIKYYPNFDKLPIEVQFALWDMSYNLGYPKLSKFKKLKEALEQGDYKKAAEQSKRNGIGAGRNSKVMRWIESATVPIILAS